MSFLNFVITDDFISVICDGQLSKDDSEIIFGDYQKFYVHKNNFIVGATGQQQPGKELLDFCKYNDALSVTDIELKMNEIVNKYYMLKDINGDIISFYLALAHFTENGSNLRQISIKKENIQSSNILSPSSITSDPSDITFSGNDIVLRNIKMINNVIDIESVHNAQKKAIRTVAENSNQVNNTIFNHLLIR